MAYAIPLLDPFNEFFFLHIVFMFTALRTKTVIDASSTSGLSSLYVATFGNFLRLIDTWYVASCCVASLRVRLFYGPATISCTRVVGELIEFRFAVARS